VIPYSGRLALGLTIGHKMKSDNSYQQNRGDKTSYKFAVFAILTTYLFSRTLISLGHLPAQETSFNFSFLVLQFKTKLLVRGYAFPEKKSYS